MSARDIEAAAEKWRNRQESEFTDPQPPGAEAEHERRDDYSDADIIRLQRETIAAQNELIAKQTELIALLKSQAQALHMAIKRLGSDVN